LADFKNPQQEPGAERRLMLVLVLTFLGFIAFQAFLKKYTPQPPVAQTQNQPAPTQTAAATPAPVMSASAAVIPNTVTKQGSAETETVIENDLYRITFTNRGAQVKSWILKEFDNDAQNGLLDLVNPAAAQKFGYPLSLWTYDEAVRNRLNSALYVLSETRPADPLAESIDRVTVTSAKGELAGQTLKAPASISFEYSDSDVSVHKTYKFDHSYVVEMQTTVEQKGATVTAFPMWPAGFGDQTKGSDYAASQIAYQYDSKVERLAIKKVSSGGTLQGPFHWAGIEDQWFAAVFIPQDPQSAAMVTLRNTIEIPHDASDRNNKQVDKVEILGTAVGSLRGLTADRLYIGPKALEELEKIPVPGITGAEPDLRAVVDFGWLGIIARPLFLWLKWTHDHIVRNWGWAIVLQTLIINLALLPLRLSQMKSMLKMQRVAPQIKAIQEKYKKYSLRDPRKAEMNQEVSALYKKEGVNPAGGCLPLLIQMPFLFAYYRMLGVAIDLRHASWGWVHDLSAPDPWHILPIAIVVTMFFMQRLTPQAAMDPAQQKMMNIMMPVMLGYISLNLAAGLCLYWSMGNLIGLVQQAVMNRTALGREMREMMEKRARKKDK